MKFIRNIIVEKANMIDAGQDIRPDIRPDVETDLRQAFATRHPDNDTEVDAEVAVDADAFDLVADAISTPESNSKAVMRTIYHPGPPLSEAAVAELDLAEARSVQESRQEAARKSLQDQMGQERSISAFQKIMQRETALPQGEDTPQRQYPKTAPPVARTAATIPAPHKTNPAPKKAGRVKTRLLGFGNDFDREPDLFASGETATPAPQIKFPVGWMVIVSGPGRGTAFTLFNGVSQIGRGEDQAVRLDFGDTSISRSNHAAVAYDPEQQNFYLGHGGKANLVRLNGNPVLSTEPLGDGAEIRLGETTLRFVGLCGSAFDWGKTASNKGNNESDNAQFD
ncbi:MAG: FHA domain-containing protein [Rhodobacteraceae bacterium]|nr:FHA domain-containing protein [Paracoccaceae bacterium]